MKSLALLLALPAAALAADPALTIYNQNFAVVRETVPLDLKTGVNDVRFSGITSQLEPDSIILRDPAGRAQLQILEQSFRNDPVSQPMMLALFEGKEIEFAIHEAEKPDRIVKGKIIRSGYVPPNSLPGQPDYGQPQGVSQPIIEVDGKLQFDLPGMPIFPALADETILRPELNWKLNSSETAKFDAEIAYITGGMSWQADYNLVAPAKGDRLDLVGWVTINNRSGKDFRDARIKLMAGDVNKLQPQPQNQMALRAFAMKVADAAAPPVTEKSFDEFHLYTLQRPATLRDSETKQVEFVRATGIVSQRLYVYDGALVDWNQWRGADNTYRRQNPDFGSESNPKVWVMREFKNTRDNGLGIPLPKGRMRFYTRDDDGQLEFVGENEIDHTPKDETVRVYVGNAFDIVGERRRLSFKVDTSNDWADESFEITLRNRKKEPVEVRVVEHLYRWVNWEIRDKSDSFTKLDAQKIEFRVTLKPDEERKITYSVHYSW